MKILVTGRNGQLAQSLAERVAAQRGIEMIFVARPEVDLAIEGSARKAIFAIRPNVVVNAAAFTAVDLAESHRDPAWRINAGGAGEVAAAAHDVGAKIIHVSTDYVFDGEGTEPSVESRVPAPINEYGHSKLAGENAVRAANPAHLIVRTSWLFSPFGRNFVRTMIELGEQRDSIRVVADQRGNPTSAHDLADAILLIATLWAAGTPTGLGETYHIAGSGIASWYELSVAVQGELSRLGRKAASVLPIETADWPTAAKRPANSALDSAKFRHDFGWTMPDWRRSLGPVVERIVGDS